MEKHKETSSLLIKKRLEEEIAVFMKLLPGSSSEEMGMEREVSDFVEKIKGADNQVKKCLGWAIIGVFGQMRIKKFSNEELRNLGNLFLRLSLPRSILKRCFDFIKVAPLENDAKWKMLIAFHRAGKLSPEDAKFVLGFAVSRLENGDGVEILNPLFYKMKKGIWIKSLTFLKMTLSPELFKEVKKELEDFFEVKVN